MGALLKIDSDNPREDIIEKEKDYFEYINIHIANVKKAYNELFLSKADEIILPYYTQAQSKDIIERTGMYVANHDSSKFSDDEFYAYRRYHYPTDKEKAETDPDIIKKMEDDYQMAWHHHVINNPHHPKFWKVVTVTRRGPYETPEEWTDRHNEDMAPQNMSIISIIHAICDWEAVAIYFKSSTVDWYINKAQDERACMTLNTRIMFDKILSDIYNTKIPSIDEMKKHDEEILKKLPTPDIE
jgi:hypothetical protein